LQREVKPHYEGNRIGVLCWDAALPSPGKYRKGEHWIWNSQFPRDKVDSEMIANRPKSPVIGKFGSQLMRTGLTMTLVTIGDYTFNPEAIDLVKGDREDYCEVFFRNGERVEFHMSQSNFKGAVLKQA